MIEMTGEAQLDSQTKDLEGVALHSRRLSKDGSRNFPESSSSKITEHGKDISRDCIYSSKNSENGPEGPISGLKSCASQLTGQNIDSSSCDRYKTLDDKLRTQTESVVTKPMFTAVKCDMSSSSKILEKNLFGINKPVSSTACVTVPSSDSSVTAKPLIVYLQQSTNLDLLASVASPEFKVSSPVNCVTHVQTSNNGDMVSCLKSTTENKRSDDNNVCSVKEGNKPSVKEKEPSDHDNVDVKRRLVMKINNQNIKPFQSGSSSATLVLPESSAASGMHYAVPLCLVVNPSEKPTHLNITFQNFSSHVNLSVENCLKAKTSKVLISDSDKIEQKTGHEKLLHVVGTKRKIEPKDDLSGAGLTPDCDVTSSGLTVIKKGKGMSKKGEGLKFPPCVVCGGESSGYHYGRNTCEACKNFYRRCLLRKEGVNFICTQGKDCEISYKKNKNNCSACRYDKCVALGMSKEKCKMGRYTYSRRTETINQVRKLEGKDTDEGNISEPMSISSVDSVDSELDSSLEDFGVCCSGNIYTARWWIAGREMNNKEMIDYLVQAVEKIRVYGDKSFTDEEIEELCRKHYADYKHKISMFGPMGDVSQKEYYNLLKNYGIDIDGQFEILKNFSQGWDELISRYCQFAKQIPGFCKLNYKDQSTLLKATNPAFFTVLMHKGYRREYDVYIEVNGRAYHTEEAMDRFLSRQLVTEMQNITVRLQDLRPSKPEVALFICIITMSGDLCTVENRPLVDNVQLQLTHLLFQEMVQQYGHSAGVLRFSKFIDILVMLKEITICYQKEYKAMCEDPFFVKQVPYFDTLKPDEV